MFRLDPELKVYVHRDAGEFRKNICHFQMATARNSAALSANTQIGVVQLRGHRFANSAIASQNRLHAIQKHEFIRG
jgi:hypothetical protein